MPFLSKATGATLLGQELKTLGSSLLRLGEEWRGSASGTETVTSTPYCHISVKR